MNKRVFIFYLVLLLFFLLIFDLWGGTKAFVFLPNRYEGGKGEEGGIRTPLEGAAEALQGIR